MLVLNCVNFCVQKMLHVCKLVDFMLQHPKI